MSDTFSYSPLTSSHCTRVLKILPASNLNDPIHVELREISLLSYINQNPSVERIAYDALSYVWGAKVGSRPIHCDGKQFLVTPNCELALRYLRGTSCSQSLWVDAICINQASDEEKSLQVGRMGKIYQWANMVIVWLGEEDELLPIAFRYLRQLSLEESSRNKNSAMLKRMVYKAWAKFISKRIEHQRLGTPLGGYLRDLLCSPYFQRFWTLQELAMARSAMVVSGQTPLSWPTFASGADQFLNGTSNQYSGFTGPNGADKIAGFFGHYLSWLMLYAPINLLEEPAVDRETQLLRIKLLLTASHSHQTSNPKDRVFALYNMFKVVGIQLPEPDYTKSEAEINREATLMIIRQSASLDIFEFFPPKNSSQSPSWVHNFRSPDGREGYNSWTCCKNSRVELQLIPGDCAHLPLKGIQLGTIARMATAVVRQTETMLDKDFDDPAIISAVVGCFQNWCDEARGYAFDSHPKTNENVETALFKTVVCSPDNWGLSVKSLWDSFKVLYDAGQSLSSDCDQPMTSNNEDGAGMRLWSALFSHPSVQTASTLKSFLHTFWQFYESKRFFITTEGYFGTGPGSVALDDVIVLLSGAAMPMILRPRNDTYCLVGPAYVHSVMKGEAWPEVSAAQILTFVLS